MKYSCSVLTFFCCAVTGRSRVYGECEEEKNTCGENECGDLVKGEFCSYYTYRNKKNDSLTSMGVLQKRQTQNKTSQTKVNEVEEQACKTDCSNEFTGVCNEYCSVEENCMPE